MRVRRSGSLAGVRAKAARGTRVAKRRGSCGPPRHRRVRRSLICSAAIHWDGASGGRSCRGKRPTPNPSAARRARAFGKLVRVRLLFVPVFATVALSFAFVEPTPWRRGVLVGVVCTFVAISVIEWARYRRQGIAAFMVPLNLLVMSVGQTFIVLATGGLFSPVVPALVMMVLVVSSFLEPKAVFALVALVHVPATWAMAVVHATGAPVATLVPRLFGDAGGLEDGAAPWLAASLYTFLFFAAARIGGAMRAIFEQLFDEALAERDRSLALHAEQNRTLTQLGAEIAHELKNPLASVKGLASIIGRELDGKAKERMNVLRREVDRMQGILEEFLNYSRPLVPLALSEVDLGRIARDVVRLHEGMAAERGVALVAIAERPRGCAATRARSIRCSSISCRTPSTRARAERPCASWSRTAAARCARA